MKIKEVMKNNDFKCYKCGYKSFNENDFYIICYNNKTILLCNICYSFVPEDKEKLKEYLEEKIDSEVLNTFRKAGLSKNNKIKKKMERKAKKGYIVTRPPFGYSIKNGKLIPNKDSIKVKEIFNEFINNNISLNKLTKKFGFSINGIKKILRNPVYLGKIKFNNQLINSTHTPLITNEDFVKAQRKLEKITKN